MNQLLTHPKKLYWQIPLWILVLLLIGNLIMLFLLKGQQFTGHIFLYGSLNSILVGGSFLLGLSLIIRILDRKLPWLQNPLKRLIVQFLATIVFCLVIIAITIVLTGLFMNQQLTSSFFLENGLFMMKIAFSFIFLGSLISNAILFFKNWKEAAVQQEKLKREQLALQYETLKSQVNPHFLFNNLNTLTSLISFSPDKAIDFVKKLSEVYRYVLDQKNSELVDLDTELKFVESYVFLQQIRFGANLNVQVDIPQKNFKVVPLSIQMLVENAIRHNEISDRYPLDIRIYLKDDHYLTIENKLQKKSGSEGSGSGIQNIKSRYQFFTDKDLIIGISKDYFRISIPLIND